MPHLADHADILVVGAVVVPPGSVGTILQGPLLAPAPHVIQPDAPGAGPETRPVPTEVCRHLPAAQLLAHHSRVRRTPAVVAHRAPAPVALHLQPPRTPPRAPGQPQPKWLCRTRFGVRPGPDRPPPHSRASARQPSTRSPSQSTAASRSEGQDGASRGCRTQCARAGSCPEHCTHCRVTGGPSAAGGLQGAGMRRGRPQPSSRQSTREAARSQPEAQMEPQAPFCSSSTRPWHRDRPPTSRTGTVGGRAQQGCIGKGVPVSPVQSPSAQNSPCTTPA